MLIMWTHNVRAVFYVYIAMFLTPYLSQLCGAQLGKLTLSAGSTGRHVGHPYFRLSFMPFVHERHLPKTKGKNKRRKVKLKDERQNAQTSFCCCSPLTQTKGKTKRLKAKPKDERQNQKTKGKMHKMPFVVVLVKSDRWCVSVASRWASPLAYQKSPVWKIRLFSYRLPWWSMFMRRGL